MSRAAEKFDPHAAEATHLRDTYPADCRPSRIECLGSAGGFSGARFWRLETPRGLLCARRWPAEHPASERLALIHAVLEHVYRNGFVTIPCPIRTVDEKTFVSLSGHLWELSPWLPGIADYLPQRKPEKLAAAIAALAEWHLAAARFPQADRRPSPSPGLQSRRRQLDRLRDGGLLRRAAAIEAGSSTRPEWAELIAVARRLFPLFTGAEPAIRANLVSACRVLVPLAPCIRDIWHDHVLFEGDRVSGLIDFGAVRIETVAGDVARLLGSMAGDDPAAWQQGLATYQVVRPLSDDELALVRVFDESATLLSGVNWLDWVFLSQREFEDLAEVTRRVSVILSRIEHLNP